MVSKGTLCEPGVMPMDVEAVNENAVRSDVLTLMLQATPASGSEVIPREALKTNTMETDREAFMTAEADA